MSCPDDAWDFNTLRSVQQILTGGRALTCRFSRPTTKVALIESATGAVAKPALGVSGQPNLPRGFLYVQSDFLGSTVWLTGAAVHTTWAGTCL
jgi:hypothetical protein